MADVKYALDDNIKQNVLEPLHQLQTKDLKEVMVTNLFIAIHLPVALIKIVSLPTAPPEKVAGTTTGL